MRKSQEPLKEEFKAAADYQAQLATALFNQETERDRTIVLITGGALTVSFAFITSFVEHHGLSRLDWLIVAWSSWAAALVLAIVAYALSIYGYKSRIAALSEGRWGDTHKTPRVSKLVEPANYSMMIAMIVGFICFGYFSIGNLKVIQHDKEKPVAASSPIASPTKSTDAVSDAQPTGASAAPAKAGGDPVQEGKLNAGGAVQSAEDPKPESK
jgi:hypothetical protein